MSVHFSTIRNDIPLTPGVYFFKNSAGNILYIGKAANLRSRLSSYFVTSAALDAAKRQMLQEVEYITWRNTETEIEALLQEAALIKKHLPPYNIALRDDKQYLFVGFTKELFSRIVFTHQPIEFQIANLKLRIERKFKKKQVEFFGPYTESGAIKRLLRSLRRTFPYCTCKNNHARVCQQAELGLCMGFCCIQTKKTSKQEHAAYQKNLRYIKNVLAGRQKQLLVQLQRTMRQASTKLDFETAAHARDQIHAVTRIFAHRAPLKKEYAVENQKGLHELRMLLELPAYPQRIEGYDISNIQGSFAVGSMVVFTDGIADKRAYRKFRIRTVRGANDPAMIHEVIHRRLQHTEWPLPDVILIDGGRAQLNAALDAYKPSDITRLNPIRFIAIAKQEEELYTPKHTAPFKLKRMPIALLYLLQQIRNEAHRFAISYYRKRHRKETVIAAPNSSRT